MGVATCEVHRNFLAILKAKHLNELAVIAESPDLDDYVLIKVESPLIPEGAEGCQEICIVQGGVRFKPLRDA
jgi:hypothetical protein